MSTTVFFPPTYFTTYYFPGLGRQTDSGVPGPGTAGYRDRDAFAAIVVALQATGHFAEVTIGELPEQAAIAADRIPLVAIVPTEWIEVDDVDPIVNLRRVSYSLILVVRDEDPTQRFEVLDRLTSVVQNAIDGSDLGGGCLGGLTKLRRGRYDKKSRHPEHRSALAGTFSYLVSTHTGHDTAD